LFAEGQGPPGYCVDFHRTACEVAMPTPSAPLDRRQQRRSQMLGALGGLTAVAIAAASPAAAHTGLPAHGVLDGVLHPLTGVDHLLAMVAVGLVAALSTNRSTALRTPLAFVGGMVVGGLLGMAGIGLPGVETLIALSVVAFGAIVVARPEHSRSWALALPGVAAFFGAAHGHAHGAELPSSAVPLLYVVGFVAATVTLHAVGTALGLTLRERPAIRMAVGSALSAIGAALLIGFVSA
jgi:urease accessory protein